MTATINSSRKSVYKILDSASARTSTTSADTPQCGNREGGGGCFPAGSKPSNNIVTLDVRVVVPRWYRELIGLEGGFWDASGVASVVASPDWNRLLKLSWKVTRARDAHRLVPSTEFSAYISGRVSDELRFGRWLEIVAPPRSGKSAGAVLGVVRWIVERDVRNYVVLIVAVNRRLAEVLYKYLVGSAHRVLHELERGGVAVNRGDFYKRIKIRLYLGAENSCLAGNKVHYVEYCIKACPLFKKYSAKWRRLPNVPFIDPWNLKLSGYCPFVAASSKRFWYNSIVVITVDSLKYALRRILNLGIRNVVVVFDEYLVHLKKKMPAGFVDVTKLEKEIGRDVMDAKYSVNVYVKYEDGWRLESRSMSLRDALVAWNQALTKLDNAAASYYTHNFMDGSGNYLAYAIEDSVLYGLANMTEYVEDYVIEMYSAALAVEEMSRNVDDVTAKMKLKRLGMYMRYASMSLVSALGFRDLSGSVQNHRVINIRWVLGEDKKLYLVGYAGGYVRAVIATLMKAGCNVAVVSTSVVDADVIPHVLMPHESLEHVRVDVANIMKPVKILSVYWDPAVAVSANTADRKEEYRVRRSINDLELYLTQALSASGNAVIIANKRLVMIAAEIAKRFGLDVRVYGDLDRQVIDYVIVKKKDGGSLLLVSPHSRASMGVDPPVEDVVAIFILYGLREPARELIKLKYCQLGERLIGEFYDLRIHRSDNGNVYYVYAGSDGIYEYLLIYDSFNDKYDKHLLVQIIGRWYMQNVQYIFYNGKYDVLTRYFLPDVGLWSLPEGNYYVLKGVDRSGGFSRPILEGFASFGDAVARVLGLKRPSYMVVTDTSVYRDPNYYEKLLESAAEMLGLTLLVNIDKVLEREYRGLSSAYNCILRARREISAGRGDAYRLSRYLIRVVNGFVYADATGSKVPAGLVRFYVAYKNFGIRVMLEEFRGWINAPAEIWNKVARYVLSVSVLSGVAGLVLKYKLRLADLVGKEREKT